MDAKLASRRDVSTFGRIAFACLGVAAITLAYTFRHSLPFAHRANSVELASEHEQPVIDNSPRTTQPAFASQDAPAADSKTRSVSEDSLQLPRVLLMSTSPGLTPREGTAELRVEGRPVQTFMGGAVLANGARLAEIYADRVVLKHEAATAIVWLRDEATDQRDLDKVMASEETTIAPRVAPITTRISVALRTSPAYDGEIFAGLELYPGSNHSLFSQLGLRSGDLLVAVDGIAVTDYVSGTQILESLADGASMSLTVRRGAEQQTIHADGGLILSSLDTANVQTTAQMPMQLPPG